MKPTIASSPNPFLIQMEVGWGWGGGGKKELQGVAGEMGILLAVLTGQNFFS